MDGKRVGQEDLEVMVLVINILWTLQVQIVMIEFQLLFRDGTNAYLGEVAMMRDIQIDLEQSQHFTNNTWRHWAFCKESGTTTFYINGVRKSIQANASTVNWNTQRSVLGFSTKTWFKYWRSL